MSEVLLTFSNIDSWWKYEKYIIPGKEWYFDYYFFKEKNYPLISILLKSRVRSGLWAFTIFTSSAICLLSFCTRAAVINNTLYMKRFAYHYIQNNGDEILDYLKVQEFNIPLLKISVQTLCQVLEK